MPAASAIRLQIESALAARIPSALTPAPRIVRPVAPTGIHALDEVLRGGFPVGALTELVGPECSGRTSVALKFVAGLTQAGRVCAWIDVSNALDPPSAAAAGVDLERLLWVRCGAAKPAAAHAQDRFSLPEKYLTPAPVMKGLHGGGCGGHPRGEVKGLAAAVSGLLRPKPSNLAPRCPEPQSRSTAIQHVPSLSEQPGSKSVLKQPGCNSVLKEHGFSRAENVSTISRALAPEGRSLNASGLSSQAVGTREPWKRSGIWIRLDHALRATDLVLQAGGFSAVVLDLGSLPPEFASRVPLATWFRYRAAAEKTQASILLLAQYACAKSSSELSLRLQPGDALRDETTLFTGMAHSVEVVRRRFTGAADNVVPLRKPPQRANAANWQSRAAWAGVR
jgi:recombination protein RecA